MRRVEPEESVRRHNGARQQPPSVADELEALERIDDFHEHFVEDDRICSAKGWTTSEVDRCTGSQVARVGMITRRCQHACSGSHPDRPWCRPGLWAPSKP